MEMFALERMAVEYCAQYGISDDDPRRADIINAFCVGAKIEREACAKVCEAEHVGNGYNMALRHAADSIRKRSNVQIEPMPRMK